MNTTTKAWLKRAEEDLLAIEELEFREDLTNVSAFHAQQAIEKCFKAIIEEKVGKPEKVHNLIYLYDKVREHIPNELDLAILKELNGLYTDSRYPGDFGLLPDGDPSVDQIKKFHEFVKGLYTKVKENLEN